LDPGLSEGPRHGHVLVVDDERENVRFLGSVLGQHGYQVHVAESGEQALEIAEAIVHALRLDLVLLDIRMPAGLDGIETCRRLKGRPELRSTPVIFLTGKDERETMVQAVEAGGADYVLKPFNTDVLLARVRAHCRLGQLSNDLESALAESTRELRKANAKLRVLAMEISLVAERERKRLRFGVALSFAQTGPASDLGRSLAVVLFQCTRELVHNLIRHAEPTRGGGELTVGDDQQARARGAAPARRGAADKRHRRDAKHQGQDRGDVPRPHYAQARDRQPARAGEVRDPCRTRLARGMRGAVLVSDAVSRHP